MRTGGELSVPSLVRSERCVKRAGNRRPPGVGELCKSNLAEPSANSAGSGVLSGGLPDPGVQCSR
jgi:hypothetical protein